MRYRVLGLAALVLTGCVKNEGDPPSVRYAVVEDKAGPLLLDTTNGDTWRLEQRADLVGEPQAWIRVERANDVKQVREIFQAYPAKPPALPAPPPQTFPHPRGVRR